MNSEERLKADGFEGVEPVLFFGKKGKEHPYYCFSNFSPHSVVLPNPWTKELAHYKTGEHRYQALKADNAKEHEWVRLSATAYESKERGRKVSLRPNWGSSYGDLCYYVMLENVMAKTAQHRSVTNTLLDTGKRPIYEDSPVDDIWGWRYRNDHRGKNLLGLCWMRVRELL